MTKNRAAKQRRRVAAQTAQTNYTSAIRASQARATIHSRAGGDGDSDGPLLITHEVDKSYPNRLRTDLPWADLVLDARRRYEIEHDDLNRVMTVGSSAFTNPGHPDFPGSGVLEIPTKATDDGGLGVGGTLRLSVHILANRVGEIWHRGKPGVLMLITYPDGFRLGYAPFHNAEYDSSPEAVWRSFTADRGTRHDGITQFVPDTTMRPVRPLRPLNDAEHERVAHDLVRIGAYALRDAVRNLAAWLPFRDVSPEEEHWGCPAIDRMVEANTLGFKDAEAFDRLVNHGGSSVWINDARAAGYHTRDRDSLAWIEAALPWDLRRDGISDAWTEFHPDGWLGLANLRRQGWSLKAAQVLHDQIRDLRSNTEIPVSVVRTRRALLGGGADQLPWVEVDDALYSPVSWIDGDAAEWTKYAGDAATASRLIEGGHRLPNRLA